MSLFLLSAAQKESNPELVQFERIYKRLYNEFSDTVESIYCLWNVNHIKNNAIKTQYDFIIFKAHSICIFELKNKPGKLTGIVKNPDSIINVQYDTGIRDKVKFEQCFTQHNEFLTLLMTRFRDTRINHNQMHYRIDHVLVFPDSANVGNVKIENTLYKKWFSIINEKDIIAYINNMSDQEFKLTQTDIKYIGKEYFDAIEVPNLVARSDKRSMEEKLVESIQYLSLGYKGNSIEEKLLLFLKKWNVLSSNDISKYLIEHDFDQISKLLSNIEIEDVWLPELKDLLYSQAYEYIIFLGKLFINTKSNPLNNLFTEVNNFYDLFCKWNDMLTILSSNGQNIDNTKKQAVKMLIAELLINQYKRTK